MTRAKLCHASLCPVPPYPLPTGSTAPAPPDPRSHRTPEGHLNLPTGFMEAPLIPGTLQDMVGAPGRWWEAEGLPSELTFPLVPVLSHPTSRAGSIEHVLTDTAWHSRVECAQRPGLLHPFIRSFIHQLVGVLPLNSDCLSDLVQASRPQRSHLSVGHTALPETAARAHATPLWQFLAHAGTQQRGFSSKCDSEQSDLGSWAGCQLSGALKETPSCLFL